MKNSDNIFSIESFIEHQNSPAAVSHDVFVFSLGKETYGIDLGKVKVLRSIQRLTRIADVADYVVGAISVQGTTVPVMDIRIKYGLATPQYDRLTVVMVLGIGGRLIGVVTDGVADIKKISSDDIHKAPIFDPIFKTDCITGRVSLDEYRLVLLDIDRIISAEDVPVVDASIAA